MTDKILFITIDVEADWSIKDKPAYKNISELYNLNELFLRYEINPTYFITYDVANNTECCKVISEICKNKKPEIGIHLHTWTTPPFEEGNNNELYSIKKYKLQLELENDILNNKLYNLHDIILKNFSVEAKSHRAGRWGVDIRTMQWLEENNYLCDSSIVSIVNPFKSIPEFKKIGEKRSKAPNYPYFPSKKDIISSSDKDIFNILEIPLTGVNGNFLLNNYYFMGKYYLKKMFGYFNIKDYSDISFRPSISVNIPSFEKLTRNLFENGPDAINFMFHSNELKYGCSPYSDIHEKTALIWERIKVVLNLAKEYNLISLTLKKYSENIFNKMKK